MPSSWLLFVLPETPSVEEEINIKKKWKRIKA